MPTGVPTLEAMLDAAHVVGAEAARKAAQGERNRRLDDSVIRAILDSGLLKILQPQRFGGYEIGFPEFTRVAQVIARYDVSAGWVYCILACHHWWGGFVEPQLQEELWGEDSERLFVDSFAPTGKAEPVSDGFRLGGRWGFLSGLPWAQWAAVGAFAPFEKGSDAEYLMFFVPKADYRALDDWTTVGLCGSSSASIEVDRVFVPRYRVFRMAPMMDAGTAPGQRYNPGPMFRIPMVAGLAFALVPPSLGGAQAVASMFLERAKSRAPLFQQRQAELVLSQVTIAESMVTLEMIEQLTYRYADELMALGNEARLPTKPERARLFAWRSMITRRAREVVSNLVDMAGARSIFTDEPLQRFWRDVHVMGQHVALHYEAGVRTYGRTLMGLEPDTVLY